MVPCKVLGLHLRPQEFRAVFKYRFGRTVYQVELVGDDAADGLECSDETAGDDDEGP